MTKKKFYNWSLFSFLITAFFFFGSGLFVYHNYLIEDIKFEVETEDTLLIRKIKNYKSIIDSLNGQLLIKPKRFVKIFVDTIEYEIPIIPYVFKDSIPFRINQKRYYLPFIIMIDGYVSEYCIMTEDKRITIDIKREKTFFGKWFVKTGLVVISLTTFYLLVLK